MSHVARALDRIFREESGAVLATLIRVLGDFQRAEDALSEAIQSALETWPKTGLPDAPGAWLTTTARRKAYDRLRHQKVTTQKSAEIEALIQLERELEGRPDLVEASPVPDDQLRLIFTCCHPSLAEDVQVALTLRTLGGLSTPEIAKAFLTSEATLAQRLVRAKQKIARAKIPYEVPGADVLPERLGSVLHVLYLIFNEGYLASSGRALVRGDLVADAIRMARTLSGLLPDEPEARALWALMLLHDSRRDARTSEAGELVLLEDQDRSRWNGEQIASGLALVESALLQKRPGPYQIQAAIAALHAEAKTAAATDWHQIALLFDELYRMQPSPIVALNGAIAVSYAGGPDRGLLLLDALEDPMLDGYLGHHLARADMLRRLARNDEARAAYERAAALADNQQVRAFIQRRLAAL